MPFQLVYTHTFNTTLDNLLQDYPLSDPSVRDVIDDLPKNPRQGNRIPKFGQNEVWKFRIALKEYQTGKSGGLRCIYLTLPDQKKIVPIHIYKKGLKQEKKIISDVKGALKKILNELKP